MEQPQNPSVDRDLITEWIETVSITDEEELRSALLFRLKNNLFAPSRYCTAVRTMSKTSLDILASAIVDIIVRDYYLPEITPEIYPEIVGKTLQCQRLVNLYSIADPDDEAGWRWYPDLKFAMQADGSYLGNLFVDATMRDSHPPWRKMKAMSHQAFRGNLVLHGDVLAATSGGWWVCIRRVTSEDGKTPKFDHVREYFLAN